MDQNEKRFFEILDELNIREYEVHEHVALFSAKQEEAQDCMFPGLNVKNLLMKDKKTGRYYMIILDDMRRMEAKHFKEVTGWTKTRFANEEEMWDLLKLKPGSVTPYALFNIGERVQMFVEPGTKVYEGMIVGMNSRDDDMVVNPCKAKKVSNMRAAGSDEAIKLSPARTFTLEEALEFINDDELVEVVPDDIRLRKKILNELERKRSGRVYDPVTKTVKYNNN